MVARRIVLILALLLNLGWVSAQVEVQFTAGAAPSSLEEIWNVRIMNLGTETLIVRLDVGARDKKGEMVYKARSRAITLPPGAMTFQRDLVLPIETIRDDSRGQELAPGKYDFEIAVLPTRTLVPLAKWVESGEILKKGAETSPTERITKTKPPKVRQPLVVDSTQTGRLPKTSTDKPKKVVAADSANVKGIVKVVHEKTKEILPADSGKVEAITKNVPDKLKEILPSDSGKVKGITNRLKHKLPNALSGDSVNALKAFPALANQLPRRDSAAGNKFLQIGGTARISSQYSSRQGTLQQTPANYVRTELDPTIRIGSIPLGMRVLLSTENSPEHPVNQVSFSFDADQFRQGLYDKTLSKIGQFEQIADPAQLAELGELKDKLMKQELGDVGKIREQLADPDLRGQLAQLSSLEPLQTALAHPRFAEGKQELDSLESRFHIDSEAGLERACDSIPPQACQEMMRLYNLEKYYDKLKKRVEELEAKKESLKKYAEMAEKLKAADNVNLGALLAEPGNLRKSMRALGLQSLPDQLAGCIRTLSIGTSYPFFSPVTLNGVRVDGMFVELNPAIVYAAYTRGVIDRANLDTGAAVPHFRRSIQAGKVGLGKPESSHVFLSMTRIRDQGKSLPFEAQPTLDPQENLVLGTDMQLSLFKRNLTVQAAGGSAAHSWNANGITISDSASGEALGGDVPFAVKRFIKKLPFTPNSTSHGDYAFQLGSQLRLFQQQTILSGNYSYVGAGYVSLGAPTLVNDRLQYEARVDQQLLHKQMRISGYFRRNHDQVVPGKPRKTAFLSYGGILMWQPKKLPFVRVQYAPYFQDAAASNYSMKSHLINAMAGYNFTYKKLVFTSTLGIMDQQSGSSRSSIRFSNRMYMVSQALTLPAGLTINFNGSLVAPQITATDTTRIVSGDLSLALRLFKVVQNSAGAQLYAMDGQGRRMGFYWNLSFPISRWARFELRVQRNLFDAAGGVGSGSYREVVGRGVLSVRI